MEDSSFATCSDKTNYFIDLYVCHIFHPLCFFSGSCLLHHLSIFIGNFKRVLLVDLCICCNWSTQHAQSGFCIPSSPVFVWVWYFCSCFHAVDITVYHNGFHGDLNETFFVGEVDEDAKKLVQTTYECLMQAIDSGRTSSLTGVLGTSDF